ncbi:MAG: hypothetical protein KDD75_20295 [Caldilineaceae bacterium]|nr:hypothetical protein [Caldilineaceae bacterium]
MRHRQILSTTLLLGSLLGTTILQPATGAHAADGERSIQSALITNVQLVPAGRQVNVPAIVAERLSLPAELATLTPAPAVAGRIERFLGAVTPCPATLVDEVIVLPQPVPRIADEAAPATSGFLTAVSAVEKTDKTLPYSRTNLVIRLYLFLPPALLDGSGLGELFPSTSLIPYAAAPVPATYGDFLDWTLAHETWHLIDIRARLGVLRSRGPDSSAQFDEVLSDLALWARTFPWTGASKKLGMVDGGESYAGSDELDRAYTLIRGATRYAHEHGVFTVQFDDGLYAFERAFTRTGYLPEELQHLSDLAPLLHSGRIPTLYALFNTDDERFAEFGAWWWFAKAKGAAGRFTQMYPELDALYADAWLAAAESCDLANGTRTREPDAAAYEASKAAASWRSAVANPSTNQPYTGATRPMAAALLPWRSSSRPKLTQARNSSDRAWRAWASSRARR